LLKKIYLGPSWPWSYGSWIYNYLCSQCLSPLMLRVRISIRARCTTLCDKVCQWLATDQWFSLGAPVSSTNKIDRHDITEILLKVALNTIRQTNWRNFFISKLHFLGPVILISLRGEVWAYKTSIITLFFFKAELESVYFIVFIIFFV
jgi:hypothetical protein